MSKFPKNNIAITTCLRRECNVDFPRSSEIWTTLFDDAELLYTSFIATTASGDNYDENDFFFTTSSAANDDDNEKHVGSSGDNDDENDDSRRISTHH